MGYDRLARKAAITKRNIISIMKRLEQKLALEILQEQDSARQIARRYRVFGMAAILERRRRVGMLYVIRHGGVEFVFPQTSKTSSSLSAGGVSSPGDVSTPGDDTSSGAELSPGDRPSTIPGDRLTADPGDAVSPLLRTTRNPVGTSTASAIIAASILGAFGFVDDDALQILARKCRANAPDATDEEIAELGAMTARRILTLRNVTSKVGLLIDQTARCFKGEPFAMYRRERQERERRFAELSDE